MFAKIAEFFASMFSSMVAGFAAEYESLGVEGMSSFEAANIYSVYG